MARIIVNTGNKSAGTPYRYNYAEDSAMTINADYSVWYDCKIMGTKIALPVMVRLTCLLTLFYFSKSYVISCYLGAE